MRPLATLLLSACFVAPTFAAPPARTIDDFQLKDTTGKAHALYDLKGKQAVVVVFLGTECPINNAYLPKLAELSRAYGPKGVQFLAINSNHQDTAERIAAHARQYNLPFPVLKDENNAIADRFAAERTPEVFVLDSSWQVRYRGRIDDQYGIGFRRAQANSHDLVNALDELLAGGTVTTSKTEVAGCLIGRAPRPRGETTVTFTKNISRILQKNCQECHRPGQIGPMALLTYADAADWSAMIREVLSDNRMPPWHADPRYGKFTNDRRLTKEDRDALLAWIDQGCPKGDEKDLPAPKTFAEGWRIGKPDVVFTMKDEFSVPAKTPKGGVPYKYFMVPTNFEQDMWIQAAEARPGSSEVVHHIIVYVIEPRKGRQRTEDGIGEGFLVGYAPGDMPLVCAPGMAKKIPKGATVAFQMHYTPNGTAQTDRSSVGLVFAKKPPQFELKTRSIANPRLNIPAGDGNYEAKSASTFRSEAQLVSMMPHMHLRGKDFEYRIVYPDGRKETLLSVPKYDFAWQSNYRFATPLRMPAGTRIECTAHYDNSTKNPNNPDPTATVRWGDQTWEEMMIGFVDYVYERGKE